MADILGIADYINRAGQQGRAQFEKREIGSSIGRLLSGEGDRNAEIGAIAKLDPDAGIQANTLMGQLDDASVKRLGQQASVFTALPPDQKAAVYPSLAQEAQRLGYQVPGEYRPEMDAAIDRLAQTFGGRGSETPSQQRYAEWLLANVPEDQRDQTLGVLAGYKARPSSAAIKYQMMEINGRMVPVALDPQEVGALTIGGGPSYGSYAPGQDMGQPQQPMPGGDMFAGLESIPGVQVTSGLRTPERNREVGGVPNSYHLTGQARDIAPPRTQEQAQQIRQYAAANGLEIIDEGDHWHLEPRGGQPRMQPASNPGPQGGQLPPRLDYQNGGLAGNPFASRTPEEQAALTTSAQQEAELRYLPQREAIKTQADIDRERGVGKAKADIERAAEAPKRIARYQSALQAADNVGLSISGALDLIDSSTTGFLGARMRGIEGSPAYNLAAEIETIKANLGFDRLQEMRDNSPTGGALGQVAIQELVALQSTVANLDPNQSAEQLETNLLRIEKHYANWRKAVEDALKEEQALSLRGDTPAGNQFSGFRILD